MGGAILLFLIVLVAFGTLAMVWMRLLTVGDGLSRKEKRELKDLRVLKNSLRVQAMDHVISDPFASVVLDEIAKQERAVER